MHCMGYALEMGRRGSNYFLLNVLIQHFTTSPICNLRLISHSKNKPVTSYGIDSSAEELALHM